MRAAVLDGPGVPLQIRDVPTPTAKPGWVLIEVKAFGLNRSELHTRMGLAEGVTFPRVQGIEASGIVVDAPGGEFAVGQQVMTMMGGMGRTIDGGYAEYTVVPTGQVIPFTSDLGWDVLGAIPETLQTAYGSLTVGLDARSGQSILVRGGSSSVGMATTVLAKRMGMTVFSTTRQASRLPLLGADYPLLDDGKVAAQVRAIEPDGLHGALELVGAPTLPDTLAAIRVHGTVCFTGMLSNQWLLPDFYPNGDLPRGVRLAGYHGWASDLPADVLQDFLDTGGRVPVGAVFAFDDLLSATAAMEADAVVGKIVVVL